MTLHAETVRQLFDAALEQPAERRHAWLKGQAHGEAVLQEVSDLLRYAERKNGPLDSPMLDVQRWEAARATRGSESIPERIGRYEIVCELGRGSMGTVYEALQLNPRRTVALKLLRAGMMNASAVRRFQLEVDVLGRLDHPYIASIYEAGSADLGDGSRPFLVMEFVQGVPLSVGMRQRHSTGEWLELLARLGEGVAHAHSRGVVHRDLKPDNVIVDDALRPRILDFGVARLLDPEEPAADRATQQGLLVGTLQYMSPEQAAGDASRPDLRSDVYALGMLGYELLCGRPPYDLTGVELPEALRVITEQDGPRAGVLVPELRGDVETILAKALSKNPDRRYQLAAEFVADIRRHLADEPIMARPASSADQLRRFARRNRALVGGVSVGLLLLLVGVAAMAWGLREAHERNETNLVLLDSERVARAAEQRALIDSQSLAEFTGSILLSALPENQGWDVRMGSVLDAAAERAREWDATPPVRARIDETLGRAYLGLGRGDEAVDHLRWALTAWRELHGSDSLQALNAQAALCEAQRRSVGGKQTVELSEDLVERTRRVYGTSDLRSLEADLGVALALRSRGRYEDCIARFKTLIEAASVALGEQHAFVLRARFGLVGSYSRADQVRLAHKLLVALLEDYRRLQAEESLDALYALRKLSLFELAADRFALAFEKNQVVQAAFRRVLGPEHPDTLQTEIDEAQIHAAMGNEDLALPIYEATIEAATRVMGSTSRLSRETRTAHAALLRKLDRKIEAQQALDEWIAEEDASDGPVSWMLSARRRRGYLALEAGRLSEARAEFEPILAGVRKTYGDTNLQVAHVLMDLCLVDIAERKWAAAVQRLPVAEAIFIETHGADHSEVQGPQLLLANVYLSLGCYLEAEALYVSMIKKLKADVHDGNIEPIVLHCLIGLQEALLRTQRAERALPMIEHTLSRLALRVGGKQAELMLRSRFAKIDAHVVLGDVDAAQATFDAIAEELGVIEPGAAEAFELARRRALIFNVSGHASKSVALLTAAIKQPTGVGPEGQWRLWELRFELARATALSDQLGDALVQLESAQAVARELWGAVGWELARTGAALVEVRAALGLEVEPADWRAVLPEGASEPAPFLLID